MATKDQEYPMRNPNKAKLFVFLYPEATCVTFVSPEEARSPSFSLKRAALGVPAPPSPHTQTDLTGTKDQKYQPRRPKKAKPFDFLNHDSSWLTLEGPKEA